MPGFLPPFFPEGEHFGFLAEYDSPGALFHACEKVRDAGYSKWDAHSPFPIHGIEKAMGIGRSRLPYVTLLFGLTGVIGGMALQLWANGIAYPMIISGKPFFNWQPYVPITFECGILLAALSTVFGMFAGDASTSTSTGTASMPTRAKVLSLASIATQVLSAEC